MNHIDLAFRIYTACFALYFLASALKGHDLRNARELYYTTRGAINGGGNRYRIRQRAIIAILSDGKTQTAFYCAAIVICGCLVFAPASLPQLPAAAGVVLTLCQLYCWAMYRPDDSTDYGEERLLKDYYETLDQIRKLK